MIQFNGLSTLVAENGNFVSGNRRLCCLFGRLCCRFRQQNRLFPGTKLPFLAIKLPETATKSPVSGYKVAVFGNKCGHAFRATSTNGCDTARRCGSCVSVTSRYVTNAGKYALDVNASSFSRRCRSYRVLQRGAAPYRRFVIIEGILTYYENYF